jgi:hypothetical protein
MRELIDNFNAMLRNLVSLEQFRHIPYIDLRGTLPATDYESW